MTWDDTSRKQEAREFNEETRRERESFREEEDDLERGKNIWRP